MVNYKNIKRTKKEALFIPYTAIAKMLVMDSQRKRVSVSDNWLPVTDLSLQSDSADVRNALLAEPEIVVYAMVRVMVHGARV